MLETIVIAAPLIACIINFFFFSRSTILSATASFIGCFVSFICSSIILSILFQGDQIFVEKIFFPWISSTVWSSNWSIRIDRSVAIIFCMSSFVASSASLYAFGYLRNDPKAFSFFKTLPLFLFFMLLMTGAKDMLQIFCGWEGMGLCSYLLIGFWKDKELADSASYKAFVINRIGDACFLAAIAIAFATFGSLDISDVEAWSGSSIDIEIFNYSVNAGKLFCFLLLIGCLTKSAQFGFHTWLVDAMVGPTPASALIHAATMVTAGSVLMIKCSFAFQFAPEVRVLAIIIGSTTAFSSALSACFQDDLKKVVAYSTCSQLGYMIVACGLSAYQEALFHLITHGFFKALLFLVVCNIINITNGQSIKRMSGMLNIASFESIIFSIGSLSLIGLPPFSGFFSKDAIITYAFLTKGFSGYFAYIFASLGAFLTAFYSIRVFRLVFCSSIFSNRREKIVLLKSNSKIMNFTLIPLALLSMFLGLFLKQFGIFGSDFFADSMFLNVSMTRKEVSKVVEFMPLLLSISGGFIGFMLPNIPSRLPFHKAIGNGFMVDNMFKFIVSYCARFSGLLAFKIDRGFLNSIFSNCPRRFVIFCADGARSIHFGSFAIVVFIMLISTCLLTILLWIFLL